MSKSKVPAVFRDAFEKTFTPALIISAFRKCGVYPFSRDTISHDLIKPSPVFTPANGNTSARDTPLRSTVENPKKMDPGMIGGTDSTAESESQNTKGVTEGQTSIPETGVRIIADLQLDIVSPSNVPDVVEILFEASSDEVVHPCPPHVALAAIETSLTPKKLARFAQKEARGVDDRKDPVYSTWRYLREQANGKKGTRLEENTTTVEEHPLYKAGLIPRRLVEVFQTPPESASIPRRGRGTTKARVLTSQELSDSIKQHDLKRKMAAAQKEERKRARIDKKAMQAKEAVKKRGTTRKAKSAAHLAKDLSSERMQYFNQLQDALLTCTTYAAMADMLPSKLLYSDLEVNPPSVNDAKKLRTDEVANGLLASSFKAKNLRSVHVTGDGNCFPRTGSVLCCGNEERHVEIRVKIVHELIVHSDLYLSDEFLSAGSSIANLSLKYAQYSMFYAAGRKLTSSDIRDQYEQEVMEVARRNTYCGIWQLHALTSLLAMPVQSLYPGLGPPKADLSRLILPRVQTSDEVVHILWTSTWNTNVATWWEPNHFVPAFPCSQPMHVPTVSQSPPAVAVSQPLPTVAVSLLLPTATVSQPLPTVAVSQPLPTVAVSQPLPTVAVSQPLPTVAVSQPLPTVAVSQPLPAIAVSQPLPAIASNLPLPTVTVSQPLPTVAVNQPLPTVAVSQPLPAIAVSQPLPTVAVNQPLPTVAVSQPLPTVALNLPLPTVTVSQPLPTVAVNQPLPTVALNLPLPTVTVSQPLPTVAVNQPLPTVAVNQPLPTVAVKQPLPTVAVNQPLPAIAVSQPLPTVAVNQPLPTVAVNQPLPAIAVSQPLPTVAVNQPLPTVAVNQPLPTIAVSQPIPTSHLTREVIKKCNN